MTYLHELQEYIAPEPVFTPIEFLTDSQLIGEEKNSTFLFDVETFPNFFLVGFKSYQSGRVTFLELSPWNTLNIQKLQYIVESHLLVGFNSDNYDMPMLWAAIRGASNEKLYSISNSIIIADKRISQLEKEFIFKVGHYNMIDLQEVAPAAAQFTSLKHYAARMHVANLQDLPFDPNKELTPQESQFVKAYNHNDLIITGWLYSKLKKAIDLRQEMGLMYELDLRSKSDAQISEKVISHEITRLTGLRLKVPKYPKGTIFQYQNPDYCRFQSPVLQKLHTDILSTTFVIDEIGGIKVKQGEQTVSATNLWGIVINKTEYTLGIGGLHSCEKSKSHFSDSEYQLFDRDVASYYPQIILNQKLFPPHIGEAFLLTYQDIVARRLKAKTEGDKTTAHSLKICINGCFGKLGSKYSVFYCPPLLAQVTLTGQLSLLMLIELLELSGIQVVSANTDGIVIKCKRTDIDLYLQIVRYWEHITNFQTEQKEYVSLHSRDVNNYIAIDKNLKIKAKGAYVNDLSFEDPDRESLMKNPHASIITEAVMKFLATVNNNHLATLNIEDTVVSCKDIRKFLFVRRVNGGAVKDREYLGKIIRWYLRESEFGTIRYKNKNKAGVKAIVSETAGANPLMNLTSFPKDIDYRAYIKQAYQILKDLGVRQTNLTQLSLFE